MFFSFCRILLLCAFLLVEVGLLLSPSLHAYGGQSRPLSGSGMYGHIQSMSGLRSQILSNLGKTGVRVGFTETFDSVTTVSARPMNINGLTYQIHGWEDAALCDHCSFCIKKNYSCAADSPHYQGKALVADRHLVASDAHPEMWEDKKLSISNISDKTRGRIIEGFGVSVMNGSDRVPRTVTVTMAYHDNPKTTDKFQLTNYPPKNLASSLNAGTYMYISKKHILDDIDRIDVECQGTDTCVYSTVDLFYAPQGDMHKIRSKVLQLANNERLSSLGMYSDVGLPMDIEVPSGFIALGLGITCKNLAQEPYQDILLNISDLSGEIVSENLREYYSDEEFAKGIYGFFSYPESYTSMTLLVPDLGECVLTAADAYQRKASVVQ